MKRKKKSSPGKDIISIRFLSVVLMSFVLILALLGLLYHQFQKAFLSSINRANEEFVYQVSATSSSTEEFLQNMVNQIFYSNTVSKLRSYEELTNWQVVDGVRELNTYSASSTIIDSIYIFNGKQQRVYSTSSYGAVGDSFSAFADRDAVALFENRSEAGRLVPILRHSDVSNIYSNRELYSFLFFELDRSGLPKDNAIMFNISKNWLNRLYFGGEDAFIIKEDGVLVASSAQEGEELYPLLTEKILSRTGEGVDSGYFIYQAQGRQICFFSRMPDRPWYYVKSLPYDQCLEDLRHTEEQTFLFVIAGFGILLLAVVLLGGILFSGGWGSLLFTGFFVVLQFVAGIIPGVRANLPIRLVSDNMTLLQNQAVWTDFGPAVILTVLITILCLGISVILFNKKHI